jgi:hypothetical protein
MEFRLTLIATLMVFSGCTGSGRPFTPNVVAHSDLSTGNDTAVINGSRKGIVEVLTCAVREPVSTKQLVIDAGEISLLAGCYIYQSSHFAGFEFNAEAGHTYELRGFKKSDVGRGLGFAHVDLVDISDGKRLVLRRPLDSNRSLIGTNQNAFAVRSNQGILTCSLQVPEHIRQGSHHEDYDGVILLNPGQVTIVARCLGFTSSFGWAKSEVEHAYEAEIVFETQAGHVYKFELQGKDDKCVQITDVSTDEIRPLACVPVRQLDELLGLTPSEVPKR